MRIACLVFAAAVAASGSAPAGRTEPDPAASQVGDTRLFARIPAPGFPEGIAADGKTVFVGTAYGFGAYATPAVQQRRPSKIFLFAQRTGRPAGEIAVSGENLDERHGLIGMTLDRRGRLYAAHTQLGVLRFVQSGRAWRQAVFARLPNLPSCLRSPAPCSPTRDDREPFPNDLTFDASGHLYVTDSWQATIWRIPARGGQPRIWFQDGRFDYQFGLNGIRVRGDRAYVAVTGFAGGIQAGPVGDNPAVYTIPLRSPTPADVKLFHAFSPDDGPDGITFGASGRLYVDSIASSTIYILNADGSPAGSFPDAAANRESETPYDFPSSIVFDDATRSLLVVNYAVFTGHVAPERHYVLRAFVGDTAAR